LRVTDFKRCVSDTHEPIWYLPRDYKECPVCALHRRVKELREERLLVGVLLEWAKMKADQFIREAGSVSQRERGGYDALAPLPDPARSGAVDGGKVE